MASLLILGGGRMGAALVGGLVRAGWADREQVVVVERRPEARAALEERYPQITVVGRLEPATAAVLAVKPADLEAACRALPRQGYQRILSIAAGTPISRLESWLWPGLPIIRAMPNTPALLGAGATAIAGGSAAREEDLAFAETVLSSIGVVVRLPERLLDAATGLSGSGPAYVFLVAEALIEAGVLEGLEREAARVLAVQTVLGAARMLDETGESAEALRAAVTSPGGTTAAGLRALEARAVRAAFLEAVSAATARSKALAGEG
jgi:pyrroline-5-carboxylate reductase